VVYFIQPPFGAGLGYYIIFTAFVAMPETAMYKDDGLVFRQYYIGLAGEVFYVQTVAIAQGMQVAAHEHFGLGVLAFYAAHIVAACFLAVDIHRGVQK